VGVNQVMLLGNIVRAPELRRLPSGDAVVDFDLAVNKAYKDKSGVLHEEVSFFSCTSFGIQAENVSKYCAKGREVFVLGELRQERWENDKGEKRSRVKVKCRQVQFLRMPKDYPERSGSPAGESGACASGEYAPYDDPDAL